MPRSFNTAGPCQPDVHYTLPAAARLPDVRGIIEGRGYFCVYAPRQTGKTTAIRELAQQLTDEGRYAALMVSVEVGAAYRDDPDGMQRAVLRWIVDAARDLPRDLQPPAWSDQTTLGEGLASWAEACPRPLVLFFDEVDALQDDALTLFLRQLRAGYPRRPRSFPHSVCLVGMRDVRDYVVDGARLGTSSPFNIKVESLRLPDFTPADVAALLGQHTAETGQVFLRSAVDRIWHYGRGQPWLTNALARACVRASVGALDGAAVDAAADELIRRQDTHLDSLAHRLTEPRVQAILSPMLSGEAPTSVIPDDDTRYVEDLGLIRCPPAGGIEVANPIYQQVIARALAQVSKRFLPTAFSPSWLGPDGRLDPARTLAAFLAFWRLHAEPLFASATYPEIAAHLVMLAWLDRVANGGGRVEREYAIGLGRMDLLLVHGDVRLAIELKIRRANTADPLAAGLEQLDGYLAGLGLDTGWLVIFDARPERLPASERTTATEVFTPAGRAVTVIRA
jgi:type II secretory pathway predicted ATPase ExeA